MSTDPIQALIATWRTRVEVYRRMRDECAGDIALCRRWHEEADDLETCANELAEALLSVKEGAPQDALQSINGLRERAKFTEDYERVKVAAVSSNGQESGLSRRQSGFDSPHRYQPSPVQEGEYPIPQQDLPPEAMRVLTENLWTLYEGEVVKEGETPLAGWQPIETAPKDGTPVLVYFPQIGVWQVQWSTEVFDDDGFWCVDDNKSGAQPLRGWSDEPTHWMPLPTPPSAALASVPPPQSHRDVSELMGLSENVVVLRQSESHACNYGYFPCALPLGHSGVCNSLGQAAPPLKDQA